MSTAVTVFENQLKPLAPHFAQVLGNTMPVERLIRTVVVSVERLPKLLECDRQSVFNAAMSAAVLGLEVDGVTGQAYLIPFKGRAQLVIGYKGYNTLAARSGITITGAVVREGDEFDYELGSTAFIRHRPKHGAPRDRRIVAAWACAQSMDRPAVPMVMGIDELMAVKEKSPGAARSDSPWNDPKIGFPAMCEKTVKRRLARSLPLNVMQLAARMDEAVDEQGKPAHLTPERGVVVDGEFTDLPPIDKNTPTAADLLTRDQAVRVAAPSQPVPPPGEVESGAAKPPVPTWREYVDRWDIIIDNEEATAKQIGEAWNDDEQKKLRREIIWPELGAVDPDPLDDLTKRVGAAISARKVKASA